jgi:hypothetical protein
VSTRQAIIAIEDGADVPRKVLRLLALSDGSFSISAPYHPARSGLLSRVRHPSAVVGLGDYWVPAEPDQTYRVSRLVKLAYHASGFVQFSSAEKQPIKSGRLPPSQFLLPKGLGMESNPITEPIESGPTLGALFMGIRHCKHLVGRQSVPILRFVEGDFRELDAHVPGMRHDFGIDIFVFPRGELANASLERGRLLLRRSMPPYTTATFRVFDLPTRLAFLGIVVSRMHATDSENSADESGHTTATYTLGGPRSLVGGFYLAGIFPAPTDARASPSLDVML